MLPFHMPKIIHAISGPRNISTAIMYSFAQRPGCAVFDEPLYGIYLNDSKINHPGKDVVLKNWPTSFKSLKQRITLLKDSEEIYLKNMAHHQENRPWEWVKPTAYIFWIRHPRKVVQSFTKVIDNMSSMDVGLIQQWQQWQQLYNFKGPKIVIDSDEMLQNPNKNMPLVCQALDLVWTEKMLNWPKGKKSYDGPWWPYWYKNVHKSHEFGPAKSIPNQLRDDHEQVVQSNLPAYEELYKLRLKFQ